MSLWWRPGDDVVTPQTAAAERSRFWGAVTATVDDLSAVPLFESLDEPELRQLASWFDVQTAKEGVRLIGEDAAGYSFFVLAERTADVTSDGARVATLGPGDFFGEVAI